MPLSSFSPQASETERPPKCIFVTGPRGSGVTRWLHRNVHRLATAPSAERCAVLLAEEGAGGVTPFSAQSDRVVVRKLLLPCTCCPALAGLPSAARELAASSRADWLFVRLPAIVAGPLLAEFDVVMRWPRRVVLCLDDAWAKARDEDRLSPFQFNLLGLADTVVSGAAPDGVGSPPMAPSDDRQSVANGIEWKPSDCPRPATGG